VYDLQNNDAEKCGLRATGVGLAGCAKQGKMRLTRCEPAHVARKDLALKNFQDGPEDVALSQEQSLERFTPKPLLL
jgi:hypothetical protein